MRNILLATMITLLSGCGWQLRDAQVVPQSIGSLHIATQLADRDFVSELTRALDVYGVEVVTSAAAAELLRGDCRFPPEPVRRHLERQRTSGRVSTQ